MTDKNEEGGVGQRTTPLMEEIPVGPPSLDVILCPGGPVPISPDTPFHRRKDGVARGTPVLRSSRSKQGRTTEKGRRGYTSFQNTHPRTTVEEFSSPVRRTRGPTAVSDPILSSLRTDPSPVQGFHLKTHPPEPWTRVSDAPTCDPIRPRPLPTVPVSLRWTLRQHDSCHLSGCTRTSGHNCTVESTG